MTILRKEKPKEVQWTDSQWEAIASSGHNILVSAAAGSGKTAVLIERIIEKITDETNPVDIDQLLIVTFTNAAAMEMKNRLAEKLEEKMQQHPGSLRLRRQIALLNRANISTLHSFCMKLVRKYYYKINVDPHFRMLDNTEGELLKEEVLEEVLEANYGKENNEAFLDAVDRFSNDRNDNGWKEVVLKLYDFSRSHPDPTRWLDEVKDMYHLSTDTPIEEQLWGKIVFTEAKATLTEAIQSLEQAKAIGEEEGGPYPYIETIENDLFQLQEAQSLERWEDLYHKLKNISFGRLKAIRSKDDVDDSLKEKAKQLRNKAKESVTKMVQETFSESPDTLLQDLKQMYPAIKVLTETVKEFSNAFQSLKEERGVADFSDLEHYALRILQEDAEVRETYRSQLKEILVDEYQDVNLTQETLLQQLSRGDNCFFVGDVKQSIYRFRLAEPTLFLDKYKRFNRTDGTPGWKIQLDKNFRSRKQVLDAVNFLFKQIMDEKIGDIHYDDQETLKAGNEQYPEVEKEYTNTEIVIINKGNQLSGEDEDDPEKDLETGQLEARWMARQIKKMIQSKHPIYDKQIKQMRPITYRDIVILMRSMSWANVIMEEFKNEGVPLYAELNEGYFEAMEINVMLSLLKTIDNPYQDIPLVAVLRSPIVGMNEEELAHIRIQKKQAPFFEALKEAVNAPTNASWQQKATKFYEQLLLWRGQARREILSEFIWKLFRETGYYDFVGGLPNGKQRQANLLSLYDKARAYEKTSFRGLFRFLRFIERVQSRKDDFGLARALSEQEDVVRMMTIHKSKGLEFPVVFLAGLNKQFNFNDIREKVLLHKELGIGVKHVDVEKRIQKPTLSYRAVKRRILEENLSEEMRVLYVAMTRAKEKLFLIGTVNDAEKSIETWRENSNASEWILPESERLQALSYLDWIGRAIFRHRALQNCVEEKREDERFYDDSEWNITFVEKGSLKENEPSPSKANNDILAQVSRLEPVDMRSPFQQDIHQKLGWRYQHEEAVNTRSKQTVSEYKRTFMDAYSEPLYKPSFRADDYEQPTFLEQTKKPSSAARGTVVHTVLEHLPLQREMSAEDIHRFVHALVEREILTEEEGKLVDSNEIYTFLQSKLGMQLRTSNEVYREIPFSYAKKEEGLADFILLQGTVDCLFKDEKNQLVLVDYKTDAFMRRYPTNPEKATEVMKNRYQTQIDLYREAISHIWKEEIKQAYLYMFDGHVMINMME